MFILPSTPPHPVPNALRPLVLQRLSLKGGLWWTQSSGHARQCLLNCLTKENTRPSSLCPVRRLQSKERAEVEFKRSGKGKDRRKFAAPPHCPCPKMTHSIECTLPNSRSVAKRGGFHLVFFLILWVAHASPFCLHIFLLLRIIILASFCLRNVL